jgi:hypothetical protein
VTVKKDMVNSSFPMIGSTMANFIRIYLMAKDSSRLGTKKSMEFGMKVFLSNKYDRCIY